jgi:hypothetical protein
MSKVGSLDLANLPAGEDEQFEYKSSITPFDSLKEKVARAASGFWNSGGGLFIAGVNGSGKPDGGFPNFVGRQAVRDWIDQTVHQVFPAGRYDVRLFAHDPAAGLNIKPNQCVIAVEFGESARPPHMAPDHKYYIRAGAHTVPATHYIVEALWARRRLQRPQLAHTMRFKPEASDIVQLAIVALSDEPAVSVSIVLDPLPEMWKDTKALFPLKIPVLDRASPFHLDVTTYFAAEKRLGPAVQLRMEYYDVAGNHYDYTATLDVKSIAPWRIGTPASEKMAKSFESIDKTLKEVPKALHDLQDENAELRARLEILQDGLVPKRTADPNVIAGQLRSDAKALLLEAKTDGRIIFSPYMGGSQLSAGTASFIRTRGDHREEVKWRSIVSELRRKDLIDGVFERGTSSVFRLTEFGYAVADAIAPASSREGIDGEAGRAK